MSIRCWTEAGERAVKNGFEGKNVPSGKSLVELAHRSDAVLAALLLMAGSKDILGGEPLIDARDKWVERLEIIDQLQSGNSPAEGMSRSMLKM